MATEILQKSRTRFAAQTSSEVAAGEYPGDGSYTEESACVTLANTYAASENCSGAEVVVLELDVTTDPATAATSAIYWRGRKASGSWTKWKYSHAVGDTISAVAADLYDAGMFYLQYEETQLAFIAIGYTFTGVLYATPKLMEIQ